MRLCREVHFRQKDTFFGGWRILNGSFAFVRDGSICVLDGGWALGAEWQLVQQHFSWETPWSQHFRKSSWYIRPRQATEICNVGDTSPLHVFFEKINPMHSLLSRKIAPKCGEDCPTYGWKSRIQSCNVSGRCGLFGPEYAKFLVRDLAVIAQEVVSDDPFLALLFSIGIWGCHSLRLCE